jgi:uncharacterized membrane protein YoaK (UPF0700 family)
MLSVAAGSTDALCLLHLGGVFASVITGNLVVLAASAVRALAAPTANAAAAVGAYALGVFAGSRVTARRTAARPTVCLALETALLVAFVATWLVIGQALTSDGPRPVPLMLAGGAMGMQSVAVRALGRPGLSTTYLTGALTGLVGLIGEPGWLRRLDRVQILAFGGLIAGAAVETVLMRYAAWVGPLPAAVLAAAALVTTGGPLARRIGDRHR